jgi:hypothetical protein
VSSSIKVGTFESQGKQIQVFYGNQGKVSANDLKSFMVSFQRY